MVGTKAGREEEGREGEGKGREGWGGEGGEGEGKKRESDGREALVAPAKVAQHSHVTEDTGKTRQSRALGSGRWLARSVAHSVACLVAQSVICPESDRATN